jgi:hypothetical protein
MRVQPCAFEGCVRDARSGARGYCSAHYGQLIRNRPLTAIREKRGPGVRLGGLTIPVEVAVALKAKGPNLYEAARAVLEAWAAGKKNGSRK